MKLWGRTANAWNNPTARVVVVDDAVKHILIIGVNVAVFWVKISWLTVGKVIIGMRSRKSERWEQRRKHIKDDKHRSIKQQLQKHTRPNEINLGGDLKELFGISGANLNAQLTLDLRLYFIILTNGTNANVKPIPKKIPPIKPTKFCCHGRVLIPNRHAAIKRSFIKAR